MHVEEALQHHPHHHLPLHHLLLAVLILVVPLLGKATTIVMMKTTIVDVHLMVEIVVEKM